MVITLVDAQGCAAYALVMGWLPHMGNLFGRAWIAMVAATGTTQLGLIV